MSEKITTAIILNGGKDCVGDTNVPAALKQNGDSCPLLDQITSLQNAGISTIMISTHNFQDEFDGFLEQHQFKDINVFTTREKQALQSGGAVKNAMLNGNIDSALVVHGNIDYKINFNDYLIFHYINEFENSICLTKNQEQKDELYFSLTGSKVEPTKNFEEDTLSFARCYIVQQDVFNFTSLQKFSFRKEILPQISKRNLGGFLVD